MIKVKTKRGFSCLNVLNIVSVDQDEKQNVRIWSTNGGFTETIEQFDVVIRLIEKTLIQIAGGERV